MFWYDSIDLFNSFDVSGTKLLSIFFAAYEGVNYEALGLTLEGEFE